MRRAIGSLILSFTTVLMPAAEPVPGEVAQMLVKQYAAAVVEVSVVVRISGTVSDKVLPVREVKLESLGTVIKADGITAVSLASIDPTEVIEGMRINTPKGPMKIEITGVEYKQAKLVLADGSEMPAQVVLKDNDLDVAFLRPLAAPTKPMTYVDLTKKSAPQLLATGYIVSRSRQMGGAPLVRRTDIISVVEKPRHRIMPENGVPGSPMFDEKGRIYGVCVRLFARGRATGNLVLPADDVAEVATQAAAVKIEPPTPESALESKPAEQPKPATGG